MKKKSWSGAVPQSVARSIADDICSALTGSSRHKPETRAPPKPGWLCQRADCLFAVRGIRNYPERDRCWSCCMSKAQAMNPPAHARLEVEAAPEKTVTKAKEEKRRDARTRRREARRTSPAPPPPARTIKKVQTVKPDDEDDEAPGPVATALAQSASPTPPASRLAVPKELEEATSLLFPAAAKTIVTRRPRRRMARLPQSRGNLPSRNLLRTWCSPR